MAGKQRSIQRACAAALAERRLPLARGWLRSARAQDRWDARAGERADDLEAFVHEEFCVFADYLRLRCETGDETWRQLYVGAKLRQLYVARAGDEQRQRDRDAVLAGDLAVLEEELRPRLPDDAWRWLRAEYQQIADLLQAPAERELRVLLIGDCLYLDVLAFLVAPLLERGLRILPEFATSKNPAELQRQLQAMASEPFDVVFYSPFTYAFAVPLDPVLAWKSRLGREALDEAVDTATRSAGATLELIADLFDCPIHVHNAALVLRDESALRRRVKNLLTARRRRRARRRIDAWLRAQVAKRNERSFKHLHVVDELAMAAARPEHELGAYIYRTPLQHPAAFSRAVAAEYLDLLCAHGHFSGRKLVVCDLDDTLWRGLIGEGEVQHLHDRQEVLKQLRERGVLLAINSKNDPAAVHWRGGTLSEEDFVAASIDWRPKVAGMRDLGEQLNLRPRDWVFLDDRPEERAMVQLAFPELHVADPEDEATWRAMRVWCELLDEKPDLDRTRLYREREERKRFLGEQPPDEETEGLFRSLGLRCRIRAAAAGDVQRVSELINRTNQFNLRGSRASASKVRRWQHGERHRMLLADVSDRFGDMGTVAALVAREDPKDWEIEVFVLSCRVFGYGIETAVLNALKRAAQGAGRTLSGTYVETDRNRHCRDVYARAGFRREADGHWRWQPGDEIRDPGWLVVEGP